MCTAAAYKTKNLYFGRTLDHDHSYGEEVTITPRNFPLEFRETGKIENHYAMIGMAWVCEEYPLYYDAVNEKGVGMAGLNFTGNACYGERIQGKNNVAQFEFIPWVLSQCGSVKEAEKLLEKTNLTKDAFHEKLPPAQLHWLIADRKEAVTVEIVKDGAHIYKNPVGILTNNPTFPEQMFQLNNYMNLSTGEPENRFSENLPLQTYSRGMGALGLPGDLSSQSRFIKAAFIKMNAASDDSEEESVNQFFHILGAVEQQKGCCETEDGEYEMTIYTSCCDTNKGIYYYTTYGNHQITAVKMRQENLEGTELVRYPVICGEKIRMQN